MAQKTGAKMIETAERRAYVLALRKAGATYLTIVREAIRKFGEGRLPAGWDERYAYKDVARELQRLMSLRDDLAEDVAQLETERLDAMLLGLWEKATKGDPQAVDRALRIMERRAKLLGLDKPQQQEVSGAVTMVFAGNIDPAKDL